MTDRADPRLVRIREWAASIFRGDELANAPDVEILCSDVKISDLDPGVIDRVNPDWNNSARPLARPGFEELLKLRGRK